MSIDHHQLERRMQAYFDPSTDWPVFAGMGTGLSETAGSYYPRAGWTRLRALETFDHKRLVRYALYPFDIRWAYYSPVLPLWNRPRPALKARQFPGNRFVVTRLVVERPNENVPVTATSLLPDYHLLRPNVVAIPMLLEQGSPPAVQHHLFSTSHAEAPVYGNITRANLSVAARQYLSDLSFVDPDTDHAIAALLKDTRTPRHR